MPICDFSPCRSARLSMSEGEMVTRRHRGRQVVVGEGGGRDLLAGSGISGRD